MATSALEDPAIAAKPASALDTPAATPVAVPAAPAALPVAAAAGPAALPHDNAPSPAATAALFPHYADGPAAAPAATPGLTPHKVKTQAIHSDTGPMLDAIAGASGLTKAELPTARSTAGHLLEEGAAAGVTNMNQYAYELATTRRESHMGNWMNEFGSNAYFEKKYGMHSSHRNDLQNTQPGDGAAFHGRGLVQTTGRRNYTDWTDRLGKENFQHNGQAVDLVHHPELAADPQIAARIAVEGMRDGTFTQHKLGDYVNDKQTDYYNARTVINGHDHAQEIATQATSFQHVLEQHRGEYADAVLAAEMKNLPTAHGGELSGNPTAPGPEMFDAKPIGGTPGKFEPADKLLKNPVGRFSPGALPTNYQTLKVKPNNPTE